MDKLRSFLILISVYLISNAAYAGWLHSITNNIKNTFSDDDRWIELGPDKSLNDPGGARLLSQRPILNSLWYIDEQTIYAVSDDKLYRSNDGGDNWQPVLELHTQGEWVRFDRSGMRGFAGSPFLLNVTDDGGKHWRTLDPDAIFQELTGKPLSTMIIDMVSTIWLNPDSGEGAFSAGCSYFTSTDLGRHWSVHHIYREPGKQLCITDSPFALDLDSGLAVAARIGGDGLYKREDDGRWQTICDFDEVGAILLKLPYCPDMSQPQIKDFVSRFMTDGDLPPSAYQSFDLGELNTENAPERLSNINLQDNGKQQWLSFRGQLAFKINESAGQNWKISSNSPSLEALYPVSDHESLGVDDYGAFFTSDAGRTWKTLGAPGGGIYMHWYQAKYNRLWATSSGELWVIDANAEGSWKKVSTPYLADDFGPINHDETGEILWIMSNEPVLLLSSDGGDTWTTLEFKADGELDYDRGIVTAHCHNNPPGCLLLTADGNLLSVNLSTKQPLVADKPTTRMTEHEPSSITWMTAHRGNIVAYNNDAEHILLKEQGDTTWKELPLPKQNIYMHKVNSEGDIVATGQTVLDRAYLHLGQAYGESWTELHLKGWEGSVRLLCADDKLENLLIGEDGDGVAFSSDGGKHWEVIDAKAAFCGIANGYMWIRDRDFRIYALDKN